MAGLLVRGLEPGREAELKALASSRQRSLQATLTEIVETGAVMARRRKEFVTWANSMSARIEGRNHEESAELRKVGRR